jgi:hypothetical protein
MLEGAKPALCLVIVRFSAPIPYFSSFPVGFLPVKNFQVKNGMAHSISHKRAV